MMEMRLVREAKGEEPLTWVKRISQVRQADTLVQFQPTPRKTQLRKEVTLQCHSALVTQWGWAHPVAPV